MKQIDPVQAMMNDVRRAMMEGKQPLDLDATATEALFSNVTEVCGQIDGMTCAFLGRYCKEFPSPFDFMDVENEEYVETNADAKKMLVAFMETALRLLKGGQS